MHKIFAAALFVIVATLFSADAHSHNARGEFTPWLGIWSLNIAQSNFGTAVPQRDGTIIFSAASNGQFRMVIDGVEPDGKQSHAEVTFTADGTTYPIEGWYPDTTISLAAVGRKINWIIKLRGTMVDKTLMEMAPDRRSFTFKSQNVEGAQAIDSVRRYERR
jgi:hypothetical protein